MVMVVTPGLIEAGLIDEIAGSPGAGGLAGGRVGVGLGGGVVPPPLVAHPQSFPPPPL